MAFILTPGFATFENRTRRKELLHSNLTDGVHRVFIDIKPNNGEAWAFATSDPEAADRWLQATQLLGTPGGEEAVRQRYAKGLWSQ